MKCILVHPLLLGSGGFTVLWIWYLSSHYCCSASFCGESAPLCHWVWSVALSCPDVVPFILSSITVKTFSGVMPLLSVPRFIPWGRENCKLWLFWKLVSKFLTSEFWLKDQQGLITLEKYRSARLSSSWVNYECCLLVFNLEFIKISRELAVRLGFPTSLPPTDNSQLSSFQRFLSYHQALSPATELVLFPVIITTLKLAAWSSYYCLRPRYSAWLFLDWGSMDSTEKPEQSWP